jgi:hypothetical protein
MRDVRTKRKTEWFKILYCALAMLIGGAAPLRGQDLLAVDIDDLDLAPGSYYDGDDEAGGFYSRYVFFENLFTDWGGGFTSWSGFSASRVADTNTPGYANQYAVWTPGADRGGDGAYAVYFDSAWDHAGVELPCDTLVRGGYVNNTTYAALAMRDGDPFSKKFGGADGNDPDWFKLTVVGKDADGNEVGRTEFYLADYRFDDNDQDYIVGDWTWVDLTGLGPNVRRLEFALSSSDAGAFGINTPAYFAMDDLVLEPQPDRVVSDFDRQPLPEGADFWNGADENGGFFDRFARFNNVFTDWGGGFTSWSGFAYSRVADTNTPGFDNQYAVWTPGVDRSGNGQYAVVFADAWDPDAARTTFPFDVWPQGFYVNNTTYAALAMRDGDPFSKKFGGADGADPDWFKLTVIGRDAEGNETGRTEFYLADYRFDDNDQDYIVGDWTWVDLTGLGTNVRRLDFALSSSDAGAFGMNTPAYFAMDDLETITMINGPYMAPARGRVVEERIPTFEWSPQPGAAWYRIWIQRNGSVYHHRWIQNATAWTPTAGLPGGAYRWWIQPWSPQTGYGAWSPAADFSIVTRTPGALTLLAPAGPQIDHTLDFVWQKDAQATWYELWLGRKGRGGEWYRRWFRMDGAGEARVSLTLVPDTDFRWWVRPWGPDGMGPWSGYLEFSTPRADAQAPQPTSPRGSIGETQPDFVWPAASRAEWYRVYLQRGATRVMNRWTQDTRLPCPAPLEPGAYAWWVGAWNEASGRTVWSERIDFTITEE